MIDEQLLKAGSTVKIENKSRQQAVKANDEHGNITLISPINPKQSSSASKISAFPSMFKHMAVRQYFLVQ